ncbi:MAG: AraC family transcriptional regulator [Microbacteriaceae bacterium]|nr:AraC family transcriptional regulator [Microbacteriaceae bacterium]
MRRFLRKYCRFLSPLQNSRRAGAVIKPLLPSGEAPAHELPTRLTRWLDRPASREVIPLLPSESFRWLEHDYPSEIARWNFHREYEIHLIRKGTGSYIIGDEIGPFAPGHVAMIGAGLPHDWMSDLEPGEIILGRDAVVQFDGDWLSRCIGVMPELSGITELLNQSQLGIIFGGETALEAAREIEQIGRTAGAKRMSHLFALLWVLSSSPGNEKMFVTREWFAAAEGSEARLAVEAGLSYIFENLSSRIRMSEAARRAHMSEPSFSKYFKRASGLTFSDTVKKLRIANACRLLEMTTISISSVCAEVGYSNLANFNRQFLAEAGMTPRDYRQLDASERPSSNTPRLGLHTSALREGTRG